MSVKKSSLGRGLDALLSTSQTKDIPQVSETSKSEKKVSMSRKTDFIQHIAIDLLQRGKYQPRKDMSRDLLEELAESIKKQGVIQPILVRAIDNERFEIIAGERRWRACNILNFETVPCLIKEADDESTVLMALIENIQREDLNVIEESTALQRLIEEFNMTHQQVAAAVGKSRSAVSNLLRLNLLRPEVKRHLECGDLEMGHARALLALEPIQQVHIARSVIDKSLTVRETEKLVQKTLKPVHRESKVAVDPDILKVQEMLSQQLGTKVSISHKKKGQGQLVISYHNLEHLDGILSRFN